MRKIITGSIKQQWDAVKDELERGLNGLSYREANLKYKEENFERLLDEKTKQMRFETEENWKFFWRRREWEHHKEIQTQMKDIVRFQFLLALYIVITTIIVACKVYLYRSSIAEFFVTKGRMIGELVNEVEYWTGYLLYVVVGERIDEVVVNLAETVTGLLTTVFIIVAVLGISYYIYRNIIRNMDYRIGMVGIITLSAPVYASFIITDIFDQGHLAINPFLISLYLFATGASIIIYIERSCVREILEYEIPGIVKRGAIIVILQMLFCIFLKGWGLFAIIFLPLWKERYDKKHKDTTPEELYFREE